MFLSRLLAIAAMLFCSTAAIAQNPDPVFDLPAILKPPLDARVLKKSEKDGIVTEEVMFHACKDGDKSVDIFALFAYPKGAKKLPAFVWNQGGLGQATTYWTDFGAKRGYAVICIDFPMPGYRSTGGYPIVSGLELDHDPKKAPIYFGAVALLRAVSYLETRPEVDDQRIGMAGSSWGGFYTTLMAGIDPRLKAATSMYGTGNLQLGNVWWDGTGKTVFNDKHREFWRTTLDPALRLKQAKIPIAWFTGTNDNFYWMPSISKTYEESGGPRHLRLVPNWDHALTKDVGEQVFTWLDIHLRGQQPFLRVSPLSVENNDGKLTARWGFEGPRKPLTADLIVSFGDGDWRGRWWVTVPADIKDGECTAVLPAATMPMSLSGSIADTDGFRSSTPILRLLPAAKTGPAVPHYNGCGMWGGFEDEHLAYLKTHGYPRPDVRPSAKDGKQAAVIKGTWTTPPIYGTVGVPHRLSCWLKADKKTQVALAIKANTSAKPTTASASVDVGEEWIKASLDLTPPADTVGHLRATVTIPDGALVVLDDVRFEPQTEVTTGKAAMNFIDAHVHVWSPDTTRYPLAAGFKKENMDPPSFTAEELLEHARPASVGRIALIQISFYGTDNSYMLDTIAKHPDIFVGTAVIDPHAADAPKQMDDLSKRGIRAFRIRPAMSKEPIGRWLRPEGYAKMFAAAARNRQAMACLIDPDALPELDRMCGEFPETPVIIDHLARIGADGVIRDGDVDALCAMAKHKNVMVKIGAFYALGKKSPPYADLAPLIERTVKAFGAKRCMWESDSPFQVQGKHTYKASVGLVRGLAFLSEEDKDWLLRRTAEEFFFKK